MSVRTDIKQVNNSIVVRNSDLIIVESDGQHIEDTINSFPGYWKENPSDGVGIFSYTKGKGNSAQLAKSIKLQLTADGYNVSYPYVVIDRDSITIDPKATR